MKGMRLLIGIPAYNEEKSIGNVLKSLPRKIPGISKIQVFVIDDGSSDQTAKVAQKEGALTVRHILNIGLGGAIKTIIEFAQKNEFDYLITMDADGQHDSKDLLNIVKPVVSKKSDVSIGSRWVKKSNAPLSRIIINKLANLLTFIFYGVKTSDSQSGLRCFNKKSISLINLQTDGMEVSSEIFRELKNNNLSFTEVPIKAIYTNYSQTKGQRLDNAPNVFIQLLLRLLR